MSQALTMGMGGCRKICVATLLLLLLQQTVPQAAWAQNSAAADTRLILQITVDQLRGDLLDRYQRHLSRGGFQYLLDHGIHFRNAHHNHANTETIVGHTTLATGAHPAVHGLIGNLWFDREQGGVVYNIEDARYPLLSANADVDDQTEIDPTQKAARTDGRSPAAIAVSTFSDELTLKTAGQAKVFAVSVKDRGAVSMAGHSGKAFWFSKATGEFVSSRFYYDTYPDWVTAFNRALPTRRYHNGQWKPSAALEQYLFAAQDDQPWETDLAGFGRRFPHAYGAPGDKYFTTKLTVSPAGDEMTLDFATQIISHEQLGVDAIPDYLSVSFSSTDYVGHLFGPSSLEAEDNFLRLDRTLAKLLSFVDRKVGLKHTLIVLSADHGGAEAPGTLQAQGFDVDYVNPEEWDKHAAIVDIKQQFGIRAKLIDSFIPPYIYLNPEAVAQAKATRLQLEQAIAKRMIQLDGVYQAYSSTALTNGQVSRTRVTVAAINNHYPARSGDVFVVFEPHRFVNHFDGLAVASHHGSPWGYDTYVPIIVSAPGLSSMQVYRAVSTRDIAVTLAQWAGTNQPSGASGDVLVEVFEGLR